MTMERTIDEILKAIRELDKKSDARFSRLEASDQELLGLILEERGLNNFRFTQLSTGLMDVRKEVGELRTGLGSLDAKIDKVYDSLSQDIQVFAEDLHHVKRRVTRLEKLSS